MKVALIGICRYSNEYVEEWINHYLSIGIDHIYLCDNNDINDDSLEHLLFNKFKNVSLINLRSDPHPSFIELQDKAYTTLYKLYSEFYDYICFFDIDEFLILNKDNTIQEYLSRPMFDGVSQIHVPWLVYDDNDLVYNDGRPVLQRFTRVSQKYYDIYENYGIGIKSIVKTNFNINFFTPHTSVCMDDNQNFITVDNNGNICDASWSSQAYVSYEYCQLNHYTTKTAEEYLYKNHQTTDKQLFVDNFFKINEDTPEKRNLININNIK